MRIIGLDVGSKRIGIAVSDELLITAQALEMFERVDLEKDSDKINKIVEEHNAGEVVVGLPLNMNGSLSPQTKEVIAFVEFLKKNVRRDISIKTWDERLTSAQAERILLEADVSRRKRRFASDKLSAQIILQGYLNSKNSQAQENA